MAEKYQVIIVGGGPVEVIVQDGENVDYTLEVFASQQF